MTARGWAQTRKKRESYKYGKAAPAGRMPHSHRQSSHPSERAVLKTTEQKQAVLEPECLQLLHRRQTSQRQSGLLPHGRPPQPCCRPSCPQPRATLELAAAALVGRLLTVGWWCPPHLLYCLVSRRCGSMPSSTDAVGKATPTNNVPCFVVQGQTLQEIPGDPRLANDKTMGLPSEEPHTRAERVRADQSTQLGFCMHLRWSMACWRHKHATFIYSTNSHRPVSSHACCCHRSEADQNCQTCNHAHSSLLPSQVHPVRSHPSSLSTYFNTSHQYKGIAVFYV